MEHNLSCWYVLAQVAFLGPATNDCAPLVGTTTTAFLILSVSMNSPTFRVLTIIFLLVLLIDYFVNCGFTIYYTIYGHLLIKEEHDDKEEEKMA